MKKKLISAMIAVSVCTLLLSACGGQTSSADTISQGSESAVSEEKQKVQVPNSNIEPDVSAFESQRAAEAEELRQAVDGTPVYEDAIKKGLITSDAPKLTYTDIKAIAEEVTNDPNLSEEQYYGSLIEKVYDIQFYPDRNFSGMNSGSKLYYWPDANTEEERRECIIIKHIGSAFTVTYEVYDDDDNLLRSESIYPQGEPTEYEVSQVSYDPNEIYTGEDVLIPEEQRSDRLTKTAKAQLEALEELERNGNEYGEFVFQKRVLQGIAKPNMRKITVEEIKSLIRNTESEVDTVIQGKTRKEALTAWVEKMVSEIQKIQYFSDAYIWQDPTYIYWPDADTLKERHQDIFVDGNAGEIYVCTYDDDNKMISQEILFSLKDKLNAVQAES